MEYTLLLAFLALLSVGLAAEVGGGLKGPWATASTTISAADPYASSTAGAPAQPETPHQGGHAAGNP